MNAIQPPGLSDAWLEIAEYTLDASKVVFGSDNYPVACELAWGAAENAVKATIFHKAKGGRVPDINYKSHRIPELYRNMSESDSFGISESVAEFADYDEYVRYPEWKDSSEIKMPADKYTEARAEKALVSAGLILDAARAYVA